MRLSERYYRKTATTVSQEFRDRLNEVSYELYSLGVTSLDRQIAALADLASDFDVMEGELIAALEVIEDVEKLNRRALDSETKAMMKEFLGSVRTVNVPEDREEK